MPRGLTLLLAGLLPGRASAHGAGAVPLLADGALVVCIAAAAGLYFLGFWRLWWRVGRSRASFSARAACFGVGTALLSVTLLSRLDALAERALSAHMIQHLALMLVIAPLLVVGRPVIVSLWALPASWRGRAASLGRGRLGTVWRRATHPLPAWLVYLVALWAWHAPPLHEAALRSDGVHVLQHASFLAAAMLFWSAILAPRRGEGRAVAFLALFATAVQSGALAALMTTSRTVWYPAYGGSALPFGLTPLEDQQLGGAMMWGPSCALLIAAALGVFARLLRDLEVRTEREAA